MAPVRNAEFILCGPLQAKEDVFFVKAAWEALIKGGHFDGVKIIHRSGDNGHLFLSLPLALFLFLHVKFYCSLFLSFFLSSLVLSFYKYVWSQVPTSERARTFGSNRISRCVFSATFFCFRS
jgi:hypothetical protein